MIAFIRRQWLAIILLSVMGLLLVLGWVLLSDPSPTPTETLVPTSAASADRIKGIIVLASIGVTIGYWLAKKVRRAVTGTLGGPANTTVRNVVKISLALILTFTLCVLLISWRGWEESRDLQIGRVPTWAPKLLVTAVLATIVGGLLSATTLSTKAKRWILIGSLTFVAVAYVDAWGVGISIDDLGRARAYAKQPDPVVPPIATTTKVVKAPTDGWSKWVEIPDFVRFERVVSGRTLCQNASGREWVISPKVNKQVGKVEGSDKKFRLQSLEIFPTIVTMEYKPLSEEEREKVKRGIPLP